MTKRIFSLRPYYPYDFKLYIDLEIEPIGPEVAIHLPPPSAALLQKYIAGWREANVWASGGSTDEAIENAKNMIGSMIELLLDQEDGELVPSLLMQKMVMLDALITDESLTNEMLSKIYEFSEAQEASRHTGFDYVCNSFDNLFLCDRFDDVDAALARADLERVSVSMMVAMSRFSYAARDKLPAWKGFIGRVFERMSLLMGVSVARRKMDGLMEQDSSDQRAVLNPGG